MLITPTARNKYADFCYSSEEQVLALHKPELFTLLRHSRRTDPIGGDHVASEGRTRERSIGRIQGGGGWIVNYDRRSRRGEGLAEVARPLQVRWNRDGERNAAKLSQVF